MIRADRVEVSVVRSFALFVALGAPAAQALTFIDFDTLAPGWDGHRARRSGA